MSPDVTEFPVCCSLETALEKCRELGLRMSRQRRAILELLWDAQDHLSAREIYDRLHKQGCDIGHTSVYQNLDALASHGVIECVERANGRLYGNISDSHSHVNCLGCNGLVEEIIDVHITLPKSLLQEIEAQTGVTIVDYRVNFFGYRTSSPENPL